MAGEYIFTMRDLRKVVPPSREILKGIYLSFFPGAKIGVLGANGAGKSSLLRIMAGMDKDFLGDARPLPGTKIGFLPQEPDSTRRRTSAATSWRVSASSRQCSTSSTNQRRFAEPMGDDEMTRLLEKQGKPCRTRSTSPGLWELDHKIDLAMDALRLPPGDAEVAKISGGERRRVALCRPVLEEPDMLLLTSPPTISTPRSSGGSSATCGVQGHRRRRTHDRYFLATCGWILELYQGPASVGGNYTSWLEQKERRLARRKSRPRPGRRPLQRELEWCAVAAGAAGKSRLASPLRGAARGGRAATEGNAEILIPSRIGGRRGRGRPDVPSASATGLLFENLTFALPRGGSSGVDRPQRAGKTTAFRMITEPTADTGTLTVGSTVQIAYVDQSRERARPRQDGLPGDQRRAGPAPVRPPVGQRARLSAGFNFRGADQQRR